MLARVAVAAAVLLATAAPALAEFEGVADIKMTAREPGQQLTGTGKLYVSKVGWRMEVDSTVPAPGGAPAPGKAAPAKSRIVVFGKMATPHKRYMVNDGTKTYAVMDDEKDEQPEAREERPFKVTKLGQDTVAGLSCTKVKAVREGDDETHEACLAKDFVSDAWIRAGRGEERDWYDDAVRAGVSGFPVRAVTRDLQGNEKHRMEILKLQRRSVPASMFEVPAGYKQASPMELMAQDPEMQRQLQEAQRQMQESMKDMTPEQRKMMEDMMQKYGGGQKP